MATKKAIRRRMGTQTSKLHVEPHFNHTEYELATDSYHWDAEPGPTSYPFRTEMETRVGKASEMSHA